MALASTEVTTSAYVKIGDNVSTITFQCQSNNPLVIGITSTNSAPTATSPGLVYKTYEGEMKKTVTDLSHVSGAAYVWAKSLTGDTAKVIYEGA
tara:strand:- start:4711 stop:4992 length:282 start_codon:yes stop_codon:yes gene_type:complete